MTLEYAADASAIAGSASSNSAAVSDNLMQLADTINQISDIDTIVESVEEGAFQKFLASLPEKALNLGLRVIICLLLLFIGSRLIKFTEKLLVRSLYKAGVEKGATRFISLVAKILLYILLIMFAASSFGIDAASIIAIVGSMGLTVGLALQGSLSNFAGGLILLLTRPFTLGEYIIESASGQEGYVEDIHIFYTVLRTYDNKMIQIPNGDLCNHSITNITRFGNRMVDFSVGITYTSDIRLAKSIMEDLARKQENWVADTAVTVFVKDLADSAVVLGCRFYVPATMYFKSLWDYTEAVKLSFDENGIGIPFPQMDVWVKEFNDGKAQA